MTFSPEIPDIEDIKILENTTYETLKLGCKECGYKHIVFQAAISVEMETLLRLPEHARICKGC